MKHLWMVLIVGVVSLLAVSVVGAAPSDSRNFTAHLKGANEIPPRDTDATGQAIFQLNAAGTALSYRLVVANIENVVAAHIHCGTPTQSGPVGVTLFSGGTPGGGRTQGILAAGTKTAPDAGNSCGWTSLAQVVAALRAGTAYVNVHTNDGVAPTNTGPGDFPGGEIRGQVSEGGPS